MMPAVLSGDEKIERLIEAIENLAQALANREVAEHDDDYDSNFYLVDRRAELREALRLALG